MLTTDQIGLEIEAPGHLGGILSQKVWGVVSNFAVDVLYDGLTYREACDKAKEEANEPGRDALVVLLVREYPGKPL